MKELKGRRGGTEREGQCLKRAKLQLTERNGEFFPEGIFGRTSHQKCLIFFRQSIRETCEGFRDHISNSQTIYVEKRHAFTSAQ